jgi:HD-like signal output (HDOD) protein/signal transduction histidine kinase/CheY-like chemotaxis protein
MDSKRILNSVKLPTLSKTLYEIIELEKENSLSFLKDVKTAIEKDPLLSAHILKVANSPLYGFSQKIRTISHAIGLLGIRKIRTIAFTFSIFDFFKKVDYREEFGKTFNLILKKSLLISSISTILANKTDQVNSDELYVSGLLSDIGQLILFLHSPIKYSEIYTCIDKKLIPKEKKIFDIDHVELAVDFCSQWSFPTFIETGVKNHSSLENEGGLSKISFISNQIAELLLTDEEEERQNIFKEVENHTKKLLHLSLTEVEETIKTLPFILETFIHDFPELQKDLSKIIKSGSSLIINLMKREMDMVILTKELTDSQKRLSREKIFLSHMLNLSYFFSSLISPEKVMTSLFEYFENFITEFSIEFIYKTPGDGKFMMITGKEMKGIQIDINEFDSLLKARISNEVVRMKPSEMLHLNKNGDIDALIFPISYHNNFFGYLLLNVARENYLAFDLEMSYVQILANIIANSFQNYLSFQGLKNETNKKEWVTRELFKFDKELDQSRKTLLELQRSEIVGEMLPVIFHKLKNKLTPILGYSQILLTKVQDDATKQRLEKIEKNANELTEQLNFLRDYFKISKQLKEKENLNAIINNLKPYFERIEKNDNIKIELALDPGIPEDMLIPGQIEALITNLVDNAVLSIKVKEMEGCEGLITIRTQSAAAENNSVYTLSIRDNGRGIDEKDIPIIWSPFYSQFPNKAGLGLTICEKIISNHDASHLVESVEGEYTKFLITFTSNLTPPEREEPLRAFEEPKEDKEDINGRILIIDDEAYLVDLMKEILLNEADFDIVTSASGPEALKLLDGSFDVIISDVRMPEINGMDIYEALQARGIQSKMLMVTADPFSEDVWTFLNKNKIDYLKKPFELMEFKKRVLDKLS